jgi:hypothetical protein
MQSELWSVRSLGMIVTLYIDPTKWSERSSCSQRCHPSWISLSNLVLPQQSQTHCSVYEACGVHWADVTESERARVTLGLATALISLLSLAGIMLDLLSGRGYNCSSPSKFCDECKSEFWDTMCVSTRFHLAFLGLSFEQNDWLSSITFADMMTEALVTCRALMGSWGIKDENPRRGLLASLRCVTDRDSTGLNCILPVQCIVIS